MPTNIKERYTKIAERENCTQVGFWSYDNFPYVLGSPVSRVEVNERCAVRAFSPAYGGWVGPQYMTNDVTGAIDALEKLEALREEYHEAQYQLREEFKNKAKAIAPYLAKIIDRK